MPTNSRNHDVESMHSVGRAHPESREIMVGLTEELHHIFQDVVFELGVSRTESDLASSRSRDSQKRTRPSQALIGINSGLAEILRIWREDKRYARPNGDPRVLPIQGKRNSLESLARKCVPGLPVLEVVDLICEQGNVIRLKDGKVALGGSGIVLTKKTPETTLAWFITQVRHLAETVITNAEIPVQQRGAGGRFERRVSAILSEKEFEKFKEEIRVPMQALCEHSEAKMRRGSGNTGVKRAGKRCGISLFVFKDENRIG